MPLMISSSNEASCEKRSDEAPRGDRRGRGAALRRRRTKTRGGHVVTKNEAALLRAEIAEARTKVKNLQGQIRNREGRLRRVAADAFNEKRNDDVAPVAIRNIVLGAALCKTSPLGVCVYDENTGAAQHGHHDACLFCGTRCGVPWHYLRNDSTS